jgi:hypothetical protein
MAVELSAKRHVVEETGDAIDFCYQQGWTDGLPVIPPTEERVRTFLAALGVASGDIVGAIPQRARTITAEKMAINAVMAGCLPAYAPVVLAAVEALCDPLHNVNGAAASTGGSAPLVIVSGPVAARIGMNSGVNAFGAGNRANATIGRAMRLVLMNAGGAEPGVMDKSTLGHPGKYSYCIAESDEARPWEPFHVQRGVPAGSSAVTVFAAEGPRQVDNHFSNTPEGVLRSLAGAMTAGARNAGGCWAVVICPEHAAVMRRAGWGQRQVREFLAENASMTVAELKRFGRLPGEAEPSDAEERRFAVNSPDNILLVVAGGSAGGFSHVIPPWAGGPSSMPVTREVR